jgi:ATP-binding cassette subfamily C (CFTR/MRP) protein 4
LHGILGELEKFEGSVSVNGKVFYVSQEPWIFPASIKQNILFGNEYNEEKFKEIVEVCSLRKDLAQMAFGEKTIIGEKGINLSGGQRARICM